MATRTVISRCSGSFLRVDPLFYPNAVSGRGGRGQRGEVVPAIRDLGERVQPQALGLLADLLPAHGLVEHARAIRLEHPEIEAELAVAHEVARAGAYQL